MISRSMTVMSLETESRYRLNSESSSVSCTRRTDSFKRAPIETISSEIALAVVLVIFVTFCGSLQYIPGEQPLFVRQALTQFQNANPESGVGSSSKHCARQSSATFLQRSFGGFRGGG